MEETFLAIRNYLVPFFFVSAAALVLVDMYAARYKPAWKSVAHEWRWFAGPAILLGTFTALVCWLYFSFVS